MLYRLSRREMSLVILHIMEINGRFYALKRSYSVLHQSVQNNPLFCLIALHYGLQGLSIGAFMPGFSPCY